MALKVSLVRNQSNEKPKRVGIADSLPGSRTRTPLQPERFYSKTLIREAARKHKRIQKLNERRTHGLFELLPTQAKAFAIVDSENTKSIINGTINNLAGQYWTLSCEEAKTGKRRFVATTFERFIREYISLSPTQRHFYEIIREGCNCRLYFDLEYSKPENCDANGEKLTVLLLHEVTHALASMYGLFLSPTDVLTLDSHTPNKFSRHLVIHLPGGMTFQNNTHCGTFVKMIVGRLGAKINVRGKPTDSNPNPELTTFVDCGVYSRNRAFRLYLSSKFGKSTCIQVGEHNRFRVDEDSYSGLRQLLLDSMVCPKELGGHPAPRQLRCVIKVNHSIPAPTFPDTRMKQTSSNPSLKYSPRPAVDLFVVNEIQTRTKCNKPPIVRTCNIARDPQTGIVTRIQYNISQNRYCFRIGRHHKSNNVYWVADLKRCILYQQCMDPDCRKRSYSSQSWKIPNDIVNR